MNSNTPLVVPASLRASVSFFAMFMGWGASIFAFSLVSSVSSGRITDLAFTVSWSALFHLIAWVGVLLPLVLSLDPRHALFHPVIFPFVGAVVAVIAAPVVTFGFVLGSWYYFLLIPITTGFTAGFVYALTILTWTINPNQKPRPWTPVLFWLAPAVVTIVFSLVVWPVLEQYAPGSIYRLSSERAKRRIQDRALESIRIGDRVEDLNRRAPGFFPVDNRYVTHNSDQRRPEFWQRGTSDKVEYRVYFREGVVLRLVRIDHRDGHAEEVTAQGTWPITKPP